MVTLLIVSKEPPYHSLVDFPSGSAGQESACNAGDLGLIPGLGRSGEGRGNPLQYSCLENPMGRGAWRAAVHGVTELATTEQLSTAHDVSCRFSQVFFIRLRNICIIPNLLLRTVIF